MNLSKSTCRNFAIGGIICAGISIVIGGALLDIVGFVIGFIALTSANDCSNARRCLRRKRLETCEDRCRRIADRIHREHFDRRFPDARSGRSSEQHGSQVRIHVLGNRSKA